MASLTSGDSFFMGVKDIIMYILLLVFLLLLLHDRDRDGDYQHGLPPRK